MNSISSQTGILKMKLTKSIVAGVAAACILFSGNAARAQSAIANVFPNGNYQFQYSPTLSFTASSAAGVTSVSVQLTITSLATGSSYLQNLTLGNGLSTTGSSTSYTVTANLTSNTLYSAVIQVTDANSSTASSTVTFDTIAPIYTWEAEDWDFTSNSISGLFINNPQTNQYAGLASTASSDYFSSNPGSGGSPYRPQGLETEGAGDIPRQPYIGTTNIDYDIGFNNGGSWADYTRNYPAGTYNLYLRGSGGNGPQADAASLAVAAGTASVSGSGPYQFSVAGKGWQTYAWCPLIDSSSGKPAQITFDGTASTLRVTIDHGNCNENFYMLVPLNTNVVVSTITLTNISPDGSSMYNPNSIFSITASSFTAPVDSANFFAIVTATNVWGHGSVQTLTASSGLTFSGPTTNLTATFPLATNTVYKVFVEAIDQNGVPTSTTISFDTIVAPPVTPGPSQNYSFEAEDFNYSSGLYIDNPQTNAYYGLNGSSGIDFNLPGTSQADSYIRVGLNTEPNGDKVRPAYNNTTNQFGVPYIDYDVGFTGGGQWGDYSRNYPAGTYNIYVRASDGGGSTTDSGSIALVTSDPTQTGQTITRLGTFSVPATGGWQTYTWVPVLDAQGKLARFNGGSLATLRATTDNGNYNVNFYLLVPADPSVKPLPSISNFEPDGTALFQFTNELTFTANSSAGLAMTGIVLTVNGINESNSLSFSGTPIEWNVSCPVKPNGFYTAIVKLTDANGTSISTNVFGTYNATNYQWEAEDYDYSNGTTGGLYFDNPQVGSYAGLAGASGIDLLESDPNGPGRGNSYRPAGHLNFPDTAANDLPRTQFTSVSATDYSIGSFGPFSWANYTRHYPAGTYNVIGRFAEGAANTQTTLSQLTSGYQATLQTSNVLGTFSIPEGGWSSWEWVPLLDGSGNPVRVTLDGTQQTLQLDGSPNGSLPEANVNFFMLVPTTPSPKITATVTGNNINVSFPTQSGYSYQLLYKNNLTDPTWTPIGGAVSGDWSVHSVGDTTGITSRFYRLQIQ
jgi:hypothetical protein